MSVISSIFSLFPSFVPGPRLIDGGELQTLAQLLFGSKNGVVALAGGGATGAPQINATFTQVATVASDNDSVVAPQALPGTTFYIDNAGGHTLAVFGLPTNPATGVADTISARGGVTFAASVTQATGVPAQYICTVAGQWKQGISA